MLLEDLYLKKYNILTKSIDFFYKNISKNLNIKSLKIGCELEFNLAPSSHIFDNQNKLFILNKLTNLFSQNSLFHSCFIEQGNHQYEIITNYTENLLELADNIELFRKELKNYSINNNIIFNDNGIYDKDDCGNALQFNISIHDQYNKNLLTFDEKLIEIISFNLLDITNFIMVILTPYKNDYLRFSLDFNKKLFNQKKYTSPTNLSYGLDNRSCAVRFTKKCFELNSKRIEYRVASSNADIYLTLSAIIIAITHAINGKKSNSYNLIYGNSFDEIYEEKKIPLITNNFDEAMYNFTSADNYVLNKMLEFANFF